MRRRATLSLALAVLACNRSTEPMPVPSASVPPGGGNTWTALAPLLEARQEVGVAELQGRIYVAGGYRTDRSSATTVEVYDPVTDRWTMAAPLPEGLNHPAAAAVGDRFYVLGGDNGRGPVASTYEYDPRTNSWAVKAPLPTARSAPMAAVIAGRIFVAGGSPDSVGRTLEAYDPATDSWASLPPMPTARNHVAGGAIGGRLYVVGGRRGPARLPLRVRRRGELRQRLRRLPPERALRSRHQLLDEPCADADSAPRHRRRRRRQPHLSSRRSHPAGLRNSGDARRIRRSRGPLVRRRIGKRPSHGDDRASKLVFLRGAGVA